MCRKWKDNGIIKKGRFLYIKVILLIVFSALEAEDIMMILFGIPKIQLMYAMLLWLICDMLFYSDMLLPYFRMKYGMAILLQKHGMYTWYVKYSGMSCMILCLFRIFLQYNSKAIRVSIAVIMLYTIGEWLIFTLVMILFQRLSQEKQLMIQFVNYDAICFLLFLYIEYKKSKGRTLIRKHWIFYSVNGRIKVKSTIKVTNRTVETNIDIQYLKLVSRL